MKIKRSGPVSLIKLKDSSSLTSVHLTSIRLSLDLLAALFIKGFGFDLLHC